MSFPRHERSQPQSLGLIREEGFFDGTLIRLGGKDDTVPVHLQDGEVIHHCNTTREMAKRLAAHLFAGTIRVFGNGRWKRDAKGRWLLLRFDIEDFDVLKDAPLREVVEQLRDVRGTGWSQINDPLGELRCLREAADHNH